MLDTPPELAFDEIADLAAESCLAKISRTELVASLVNLSDLAAEILDELRTDYPQRHFEVHIEPCLAALGHCALLRIALTNLLSNAWKFTARQSAARIEFGKQERKGTPYFFVRDNGVGLDAAYAKDIFMPFRRLHLQEEFAGSGIGLTTAQRILVATGAISLLRARQIGERPSFSDCERCRLP